MYESASFVIFSINSNCNNSSSLVCFISFMSVFEDIKCHIKIINLRWKTFKMTFKQKTKYYVNKSFIYSCQTSCLKH